jgi:hypothetical protein
MGGTGSRRQIESVRGVVRSSRISVSTYGIRVRQWSNALVVLPLGDTSNK